MRKAIIAIGIIATLAVIASQSSMSYQVQQTFDKTIEVTGSGTVKAAPSEAHVIVAVETEAKTAGKASQSNAEKMNSVYAELRKVVDEKSIKTKSYSLQPIYEWIEESGIIKKQRREIVGYRATNTIEIVCKPEKAGNVVDAAITGGANRIKRVGINLSGKG
jgi:uncharacterized protein YggE